MVLYVYFLHILLLFVSTFVIYSPKTQTTRKNWAQREVLKTERQTRHLLQQMTRLPLLFY